MIVAVILKVLLGRAEKIVAIVGLHFQKLCILKPITFSMDGQHDGTEESSDLHTDFNPPAAR